MSKTLPLLTYPEDHDQQLVKQLIEDYILRPIHQEVWQKLLLDNLLPFKTFTEILHYLSQSQPVYQYLILALLQHYSYSQLLTAYHQDDYKLDQNLLTAFNCLTAYYTMNDDD